LKSKNIYQGGYMAEKIMFVGINFHSKSHLYWFGYSMFLLAICISVLLPGLIINERNVMKTAFDLLSVNMCFHFWTVVMAVYFVKIMKVKGGAFSEDCIWFNSLMAVIYFAMYGLIKLVIKGGI
jgi:hypothetical protein